MEKALRLVRRSGTAGAQVLVKLPPFHLSHASWALVGDYLIELLDKLGYVGSVEQVVPRSASTHQTSSSRWRSTYGPRITRPHRTSSPTGSRATRSYPPSAGFCDPRIDAMIDRATQMQLDDPAAAGAPLGEDRSGDRRPGSVRVARESDRRRVRLRASGQLPVQSAVGQPARSDLGAVAHEPASSTIHDQRASLPGLFGGAVVLRLVPRRFQSFRETSATSALDTCRSRNHQAAVAHQLVMAPAQGPASLQAHG